MLHPCVLSSACPRPRVGRAWCGTTASLGGCSAGARAPLESAQRWGSLRGSSVRNVAGRQGRRERREEGKGEEGKERGGKREKGREEKEEERRYLKIYQRKKLSHPCVKAVCSLISLLPSSSPSPPFLFHPSSPTPLPCNRR